MRSHVRQAAGVHPGDRSPARPDGDKVDGREPRRLSEPRRELVHDVGPAALHDGDIGAGSADVQRDDLFQAFGGGEDTRGDNATGHAGGGRDPFGRLRPGGRTRCQQACGKAGGALDGEQAAAGVHHVQAADEPDLPEARLQGRQVVTHDGGEVGVQDGGGGALELRRLPQQRCRGADERSRHLGAHNLRRIVLVDCVHIGMQERDGKRADAAAGRQPGRGAHLVGVQRSHHVAGVVQPLGDLEAVAARHQRRRRIPLDVVGVATVVPAQLEHVAETPRRQQSCRCSPLGDHGVRGNGGAVGDHLDLSGLDAGGGDRVENALIERRGSGRHLGNTLLVTAHCHEVGERTARVDPDLPAALHDLSLPRRPKSAPRSRRDEPTSPPPTAVVPALRLLGRPSAAQPGPLGSGFRPPPE